MQTRILEPILAAVLSALLTVAAAARPVTGAAPAGPPKAPSGPTRVEPPLQPVVPSTLAEQPPGRAELPYRAPERLEEIVELAQRSSPEVIIAEAQLREAEARLRQARLEATQKAIQMHRDRKITEIARRNVQEVEQKYQAGVGTTQELLAAQERLAGLEAALASSNAALEIMTAQPAGSTRPLVRMEGAPRVPAERPVFPDSTENETHIALDQPVSIDFSDITVSGIAERLSEYVGVNIVVDPAADQPIVSVHLSDVPLRDALLALADLGQDVCFVVRDHFIFATTQERAMQISAPTIPGNIPLYLPADSVETERRQAEIERQRRDAERAAAKAAAEGVRREIQAP